LALVAFEHTHRTDAQRDFGIARGMASESKMGSSGKKSSASQDGGDACRYAQQQT